FLRAKTIYAWAARAGKFAMPKITDGERKDMRVNIKKKDLVQALDDIRRIVSRKGNYPILTHCLMEAHDGLVVTATNTDVSFRGVFPAEVQKPGDFMISVHNLYAIVKVLSASVLSISSEGQDVILEADGTKYQISVKPSEEYGLSPLISDESTAEIGVQELLGMIDKVIFSMSFPNSNVEGVRWDRVNRNGVYFLRLTSTDSLRLSLTERAISGTEKLGFLEEGVIVSSQNMIELQRFLKRSKDGTVRFGNAKSLDFDSEFMRFSVGRKELGVKHNNGKFPSLQYLISQNYEYVFVFDRKRLIELMRIVKTFRRDYDVVQFELGERSAKLLFCNPEGISMNETLKLTAVERPSDTKDPIIARFRASLIFPFLTAMEGDGAILKFNNLQKPVCWQGSDDEHSLWLTMSLDSNQ
ncbi:MAG: DNA polymerase III subunit beta, partial [Candidatus Hadarchaeum sp.]